PATDGISLRSPAPSVPATTVDSRMPMSSFLLPPPVTLMWTSGGACARTGDGGAQRPMVVATASPANRTAMAIRRTGLSPCRIEDELQPDPQHGFLELLGEGWKRAGIVDRTERDLIVVRVARALVDCGETQSAVTPDLEDHGRLLARDGLSIPLRPNFLGDLADVVRVRKVGDVEREWPGARRRTRRRAERLRRWRGARLASSGGARRGGSRRRRRLRVRQGR